MSALRVKTRKRRTQEELSGIQDGLINILRADNPQTLRGLYYAGTVRGLYEKTEKNYKLVSRELVKLRRAGIVPYRWLADSSRWVRKPQTYGGVDELLESGADYYRRDLWRDNPVAVEIWCEKEALAGVLFEVTAEYAAPLYVVKGFSSITYIFEAAEAIREREKPTYIYYLGDHDPSGIWIPRKIEQGLREHVPDAEIHFTKLAVTPEQIELWELPSRPTKRSDSRAKDFIGNSTELDAIPASTLKELVRTVIARHLDPERLAALRRTEALERSALYDLLDRFNGGDHDSF